MEINNNYKEVAIPEELPASPGINPVPKKPTGCLAGVPRALKNGTLAIVSFMTDPADRWELTFIFSAVFWVSVLGITEERFYMWIGSHLFLYVGMSISLHRYFSHKSFRTSRVFQALLGLWGTFSLQGGVLFWSALHRHHHVHCDDSSDLHSPQPVSARSFYWAQMGWLGQPEVMFIWKDNPRIRDLAEYRELCWLQKYNQEIGVFYMLIWGVSAGFEGLVFGGLLARVTSYQCTALVNSIDHMYGYTRKPDTQCKAGNVWWSLPLQLGENWHANHHQYPGRSNRQQTWWEIDPIHWIILVFEKLGLVRDIK